jgi:hypothetical protein
VTSRLQHIRTAQVGIGDEPLEAETAPGADTYTLIYDRVRDDLLARYPWTWTQTTRRLARLTDEPAQHYAYAFQMPSDILGRPRAVFNDQLNRNPYTEYELTGNRLLTDAETIWMRYGRRAEIVLWPGDFYTLFDTVLRSEYALAIREDKSLYSLLQEMAFGSGGLSGNGGLYAQCCSMDAQSKPSPIIALGSNPLLSARY